MAEVDVHAADGAVPIRPDLVSLDGYHSPQVDVDVRLNTNESPLPPPDAWLAALQDELGRIHFNRYPDRQASVSTTRMCAPERTSLQASTAAWWDRSTLSRSNTPAITTAKSS